MDNLDVNGIVSSYSQYLHTPAAAAGFRALLEYMRADPQLTDLRQAAYMLATVDWECAGTWLPIEEKGRGAGKPYGVPCEVIDTYGLHYLNTYFGRGFVQLTWKANYARLSAALGLAGLLVLHPDFALDPPTAYNIMAVGMREGLFTGASLGKYINADLCDYVNARRVINGIDQAEKIAGLARTFEKFLTLRQAAGGATQGS